MSDLIQPIIGFREWIYEDGLLRSSGAGQAIWDPNITVAECETYEDKVGGYGVLSWYGEPEEEKEKPEPHDAPHKGCGCGLYAYHEPKEPRSRRASSTWFGGFGSEGDITVVTGAIAAWGKVEVHRTGFRAEKATVVALALDDACLTKKGRREMIETVASKYSAEVVPSYLLSEKAYDHGIKTPEEMLPEEEKAKESDHLIPSSFYSSLFKQQKQDLLNSLRYQPAGYLYGGSYGGSTYSISAKKSLYQKWLGK